MNLPDKLVSYFHDSKLSVASFTHIGSVLIVRVEKEIGSEVGMIKFNDVSFLSLPIHSYGDGIRSIPLSKADDLFWSRTQCYSGNFNSDDFIFEIVDQDGAKNYVVAKSIEYQVE